MAFQPLNAPAPPAAAAPAAAVPAPRTAAVLALVDKAFAAKLEVKVAIQRTLSTPLLHLQ